ncbi:MAG: VOC family protein [Acidimicrobiales bacterium]
MIGHLGINVPDLASAKAYYDELMPALDFESFFSDTDQASYRPANGKPGTYLFLYRAREPNGYSHHRVGLQHLAFVVPTRSSVHRVRDLVSRLGSVVLEEPQSFPQYPPPYFATFWHDPHSFMLEAVCHHDRD